MMSALLMTGTQGRTPCPQPNLLNSVDIVTQLSLL